MGTGACALELGPSVFAGTPNSARQPSSNQPQHGACPRARMFGTKEQMREMTTTEQGCGREGPIAADTAAKAPTPFAGRSSQSQRANSATNLTNHSVNR